MLVVAPNLLSLLPWLRLIFLIRQKHIPIWKEVFKDIDSHKYYQAGSV